MIMMGTKAIVLLMGYFLVEASELDYDGRYNILLEQKFPNTGHMVSLRADELGPFKEGAVVKVNVVSDCNAVGEIVEGNGKSGSPYAPEYDWIYTRNTYICNAIEWEIVK